LHAVTSRDIANVAGANVAAVNYHYGAESKLVDTALEMTVAYGSNAAPARVERN
jgi:AcrR family transcriptional regulator